MRCVLIKCGVYLQNWVYSSGPKFYLLFSMVHNSKSAASIPICCISLPLSNKSITLAIKFFFQKTSWWERRWHKWHNSQVRPWDFLMTSVFRGPWGVTFAAWSLPVFQELLRHPWLKLAREPVPLVRVGAPKGGWLFFGAGNFWSLKWCEYIIDIIWLFLHLTVVVVA